MGHQGKRKVRIGQVVSDRMDKSIVVAVERRVQHKLYKKYHRRTRKFMVHDEQGRAKMGDWVRIMECRPLSRRKNWRLVDIVRESV
ncbi:30S ribosomal protein S17 [bacterium SM23_57]|nr:MAG: 30S ribosomal protein S17 [bacterium SM23_57]